MLKRLGFIFLAMVITTTIADTYLIAGTWQYLLMQSMALSCILFFIYHFIVFQRAQRKSHQSEDDKWLSSQGSQEIYNEQPLKKIK